MTVSEHKYPSSEGEMLIEKMVCHAASQRNGAKVADYSDTVCESFLEEVQNMLPDHFTIWVSVFNNQLVSDINLSITQGKKVAVVVSSDTGREILPKLNWGDNESRILKLYFNESGSSDAVNRGNVHGYALDKKEIDTIYIVSHSYSEKIEKLLIECDIDKNKLVNYIDYYSNTLLEQFRGCARRDLDKITSFLSNVKADSDDRNQFSHRIRSFIFYWMLEIYTDLFSTERRDDTDFHLSIAKLGAGTKNRFKADKSVEKLIELNRVAHTSSLKRVWVIVDHQCNLRCAHCWIWNEQGYEDYKIGEHLKQKNLTPGELKALFEHSSILKNSVNVVLTGGELFIRKDAEELMRGLSEVGVNFEIQTNGTYPKRLDSSLKDESIRAHMKNVCISLDGDPETHVRIRGKRSYERLVESIGVLKKHNMPYRFISVIQEDNKDGLRAMYETGRKLEPNGHSFNFEFEGAQYLSDVFLDEVYEYVHSAQFFQMLNQKNYDGHGCLAGMTRCVILPGGDVEACSQSRVYDDHYVLGNVYDYDMKFDALWTSSEAANVRNRIRNCSPGCAIPCERGEVSG